MRQTVRSGSSDGGNTANLKQQTRATLRHKLAQTDSSTFRCAGEAVAVMLTEQSVWNNHCTVLLFMSCFDEINTEPLINQAFYRQKKVFIPTVQGSYLKFFALHSASGPWHTGPYGIQEPLIRHDSQLKQHDFPALIVVPGFAFDSQGNRLGRGKAYYDRFLSSLKGLSFYTVGICLDYQLLPSVPVDPWDVAVNTVLTGPSL